MIVDGRTIDPGSVVDADVCIIGGGPAGLVVATALEEANLRVVLLERGGEPGRPRGLVEGDGSGASDFGPPPRPPARFGGGANEWIVRLPWMNRGVRMVPLSELDLEARPWVPNSGWPLPWAELQQWYVRASDRLGLGDGQFELGAWDDEAAPPLSLEPFGFTTSLERFCRSDVVTRPAWRRFKSSSAVDVHLHASAGELDGGPELVDRLTVDAGQRERYSVRARTYVVAAGGLDNPRILFAARAGMGYGNEFDVLGRYFTDHHRLVGGRIVLRPDVDYRRLALYDIRRSEGALLMGKLVPTAVFQAQHQLLNSGSMILPRLRDDVTALRQDGAAALHDIRHLRARRMAQLVRRSGTATRLATASIEAALRQRRFPPRTDAGWSEVRRFHDLYDGLTVEHQIELVPDAGNRVRPAVRCDEHGRPVVTTEWRWCAEDLRSVAATQRLLATAVERSGIGTFEPEPWEGSPPLTTPAGSFHPSGATRMSDDPRRGVVDRDQRVHGVRNLFVTGSSTFPTVGYANPTLTVVALALRLASHLRNELTSGSGAHGTRRGGGGLSRPA